MPTMPMFPLGTVLVPHQLLPLQVFEPRYHALVADCLSADRRFGVVLIERGSEVGGADTRFAVGTVARIVETADLPGGRTGLAAVGEARLHVNRWLPDDPYPLAEVEVLAEGPVSDAARALRVKLAAAFARVVELARALGAAVPDAGLPLAADPRRATWEAAAMAPIGPLDALAVLGEDDLERRMEKLTAAIDAAAELLELRWRPNA